MEHNQNELKSASQIETNETFGTGKVWKKPELRVLSVPGITEQGKLNGAPEGKNTTIYRTPS